MRVSPLLKWSERADTLVFSQMFQPNIFGSHHNMFNMTHKTSGREMAIVGDDVFETKSGAEIMEAATEDEQDPDQPPRKKRYNRHTQHQIQEMEAFFKKCPHPDEKRRKELGSQLGLKPLQVKFWFQNKRTQMKAQHERNENAILKAENEKFRAENKRYMDAFSNASCPNCGGPAAMGEMSVDDHHLRIENVRLREEVDGMAPKYVGRPFASYNHSQSDVGVGGFGGNSGYVYGANELVMPMSRPTEADKPVIVELAVAAMEELVNMAEKGQPLWIPAGDNASEILNEEEYLKLFPREICSKPLVLRTEASRQSAVVVMNHIKLIEIFMDVNKWSTVFCGIVSRALLLEVLSTGVAGNRNGALQVITAEFQVPTPLVPTRENYMVRYCKKHGDGTWAIVDVSLDTLRPTSMPNISRRRPSGCLIQELPNGFSKVTWVEHVEEDIGAVHNLYQSLVSSGLAFGATRWVATLDRQCERLASSMANDIAAGDLRILTNPEGRKSMVKLAERMVMTFCSGVGASTAHTWTTLPTIGSDDVRVMSRKSTDASGRPLGIVLSAVTSFWMPVPPQRVFHFLRNYNSRNQWDILSNGGLVQEMAYISNGRHVGNCVSLLRVNSANSSQCNMLILQESCTDSTGCYVIYAPVDIAAMNVVLNGGDPDYSALLPSGFAILPDGPGRAGDGVIEVGSGGSLLTVAFQILVDSVPTSKISLGSIATVNSLIKCTVQRIRAAVTCENP